MSTGVNGHAITEVINRFKEIIQSGNPSFFDAGLLHFINNPVILKGLQITGSTDETTFDLTAPDGNTIKRTKIVIGYSTHYWENWKGHDGPLMPDIPITYSVKNYSNGIDEAMVYADKAR